MSQPSCRPGKTGTRLFPPRSTSAAAQRPPGMGNGGHRARNLPVFSGIFPAQAQAPGDEYAAFHSSRGGAGAGGGQRSGFWALHFNRATFGNGVLLLSPGHYPRERQKQRSEEHTSELQS